MSKNLSLILSSALLGLFVIFSTLQVQAAPACQGIYKPASQPDVLNLKNYVNNYSEMIPAIREMIDLGLERFEGRRPTGYCYRAVKGLLMDTGLVKKRIDGTFASSAHTRDFLVNRGFINLLDRAPFSTEIRGALDPHIPNGAILVYEGANGVDGGVRPMGQGVGHIEIKCGPNCYLFDGVNPYPGGAHGGHIRREGVLEAGSGPFRRRLVGVYILDFFAIF
jgi:hypothetical protein